MATIPCVKCGEPLAPGTRFCSNCGSRQPESPTEAATQILPPEQPANSGERAASVVPPTILTNPSQTPPQGYTTPQTPLPEYTASPTPTQGYGAPPQPPPAKKNHFPLIAVILGSVALCLIIGVVVTIGGLTLLGRRVSDVSATIQTGLPSIEATSGSGIAAGATARPTRVRATATVEAETTATVEATDGAAEATPTAEAAATEDVEATSAAAGVEGTALAATAEAQQAVDSQAVQATTQALLTGAQQVFRDEFVDNHNAWFTGRFNDNETNSIENGVFRVVRDAKGRSFELYQVRPLTNFVAEVDCKVVDNKEGGCGLVYGENDKQGRWDFDIYTDYYQLNIIEGENATRILEGDPTGIVRPNDWNKVRVIRRDGVTYLYINDVLLNQTTDNRFDRGKVGVLTTSYQEEGQVEIQFDNFVVSEIK